MIHEGRYLRAQLLAKSRVCPPGELRTKKGHCRASQVHSRAPHGNLGLPLVEVTVVPPVGTSQLLKVIGTDGPQSAESA